MNAQACRALRWWVSAASAAFISSICSRWSGRAGSTLVALVDPVARVSRTCPTARGLAVRSRASTSCRPWMPRSSPRRRACIMRWASRCCGGAATSSSRSPWRRTPVEAAALVTAARGAPHPAGRAHRALQSAAAARRQPDAEARRASSRPGRRTICVDGVRHWREWVLDLMIHDLDLVGLWGAIGLAAVQWRALSPDRGLAVDATFANGIAGAVPAWAPPTAPIAAHDEGRRRRQRALEIDWTAPARHGSARARRTATRPCSRCTRRCRRCDAPQLLHFLDSIRTRTTPFTSGATGCARSNSPTGSSTRIRTFMQVPFIDLCRTIRADAALVRAAPSSASGTRGNSCSGREVGAIRESDCTD